MSIASNQLLMNYLVDRFTNNSHGVVVNDLGLKCWKWQFDAVRTTISLALGAWQEGLASLLQMHLGSTKHRGLIRVNLPGGSHVMLHMVMVCDGDGMWWYVMVGNWVNGHGSHMEWFNMVTIRQSLRQMVQNVMVNVEGICFHSI